MATKPTKIVDIQPPKDVAAEASGRPLVVTNRPVLTDPMVKSDADAGSDVAAVPMARTGKTIKPLDSVEDTSEKETSLASEPGSPSGAPKTEPAAAEAPSESEVAPSAETPAPTDIEDTKGDGPDLTRDAEAEATAAETKAEEARLAREEELEGLIASGKYFVPINAAARKRTRIYVVLFLVCAVLAAVVLLDLALDMGVIKSSLPHTNFFK
jgi:hypothetical protein